MLIKETGVPSQRGTEMLRAIVELLQIFQSVNAHGKSRRTY